jgi:hypothetical protein
MRALRAKRSTAQINGIIDIALVDKHGAVTGVT